MIYILITVLILIIFTNIVLLLSYRRQIKEICRQLRLLQESDSNLIIHTSYNFKSTKKLQYELNELLKKTRNEKNIILEKERAISDIYTNISHDIRTPLTSLDGYVKLLAESSNEADKKRYISIIAERINCLKNMLEEFFTFTKLKNDSWQFKMMKCSFNRILTETLVSYYDDWKSKGITPDITIADSTVYFLGNEAAMKRTLQNILKNALEHGDGRLKVTMTVADKINLEIGNTLRLNTKIDTDKVFEKFYKADEARSKISTGLGLSIAKEFVERMDGDIYARCENEWFFIGINLPLFKEKV